MALTDAAGAIRRANPQFCDATGRASPDNANGADLNALLHGEALHDARLGWHTAAGAQETAPSATA